MAVPREQELVHPPLVLHKQPRLAPVEPEAVDATIPTARDDPAVPREQEPVHYLPELLQQHGLPPVERAAVDDPTT